MSEKKPRFAIELKINGQGQGKCIEPDIESLARNLPDLLREMPEGEAYEITMQLMTDAEHEKLGEFDGW